MGDGTEPMPQDNDCKLCPSASFEEVAKFTVVHIVGYRLYNNLGVLPAKEVVLLYEAMMSDILKHNGIKQSNNMYDKLSKGKL